MLDLENRSLTFSEIIHKSLALYLQVFSACRYPVAAMALLYELQGLSIRFLDLDSSLLLAFILAYLSLAPYVLTLFRAQSVLHGDPNNFELSPTDVLQRYYLKSLLPFSVMVLLAVGTGLFTHFSHTGHPLVIFLNFPIAFLLVLFAFGVALVVLKETPPSQSIQRSTALVWGQWWHCFFVFFVLFFLPQIGIALFELLFSFGSMWLAELIHFAGMILVLPLSIASLIVLLHDLQQRAKETAEHTN